MINLCINYRNENDQIYIGNIGVSYKDNIEEKKLDTEEHRLFDSISIHALMCAMDVELGLPSGGGSPWERGSSDPLLTMLVSSIWVLFTCVHSLREVHGAEPC